MCLCLLLVFLIGFVIRNFDTLDPGWCLTFIVRGVCDVRNLKMGLDGAKQSPLGVVLFCFQQGVCYSLALVPLKSASRASISSSEPSAFSMTLRPPDLLEGTKVVSFPRLQV